MLICRRIRARRHRSDNSYLASTGRILGQRCRRTAARRNKSFRNEGEAQARLRRAKFASKRETFAVPQPARAILFANREPATQAMASQMQAVCLGHTVPCGQGPGWCWQNSFHRHPSFFSRAPSKVMQELGETNVPLEHCSRATDLGQSVRKQCSCRANLAIVCDPIE
jgi:hypothetical protein